MVPIIFIIINYENAVITFIMVGKNVNFFNFENEIFSFLFFVLN